MGTCRVMLPSGRTEKFRVDEHLNPALIDRIPATVGNANSAVLSSVDYCTGSLLPSRPFVAAGTESAVQMK